MRWYVASEPNKSIWQAPCGASSGPAELSATVTRYSSTLYSVPSTEPGSVPDGNVSRTLSPAFIAWNGASSSPLGARESVIIDIPPMPPSSPSTTRPDTVLPRASRCWTGNLRSSRRFSAFSASLSRSISVCSRSKCSFPATSVILTVWYHRRMSLPKLPPVQKLLRRPKPGSGDFSWDLDEYVPGNKLTLYVRGGSLFDAMQEEIEGAKESVNLETYIFGGDRTGRRFAELLSRAARRGCRVRLIYDSVGSLDLEPAMETGMRNAGVQILEYHPVAPWRPRWAWNRRDHRKILVVDGRVAFTGGMNLCDDQAPRSQGGEDWPDAHARVEGPAAYDLDRLFRQVWFKETGRWYESHGHPDFAGGTSSVKIVGNQEILKRFAIREAYVNALRAARKDVMIANSYFIPDWRIRRSLAQAVKRGVSVRVLVPGKSDVKSVWYAMRATYARLLSKGVRVFEWQGAMMHAKAVVVDGTWCAVGSYNLDHRSLIHNLEVNLHTHDAAFAAELASRFEQGVAGSREMTLDDWNRRAWTERALERFFSSFDYFF